MAIRGSMARVSTANGPSFPHEALAFIQATQAKVWEKLEALHGAQTGDRVLESLCKWLDTTARWPPCATASSASAGRCASPSSARPTA
jgi:hypothetical protein